MIEDDRDTLVSIGRLLSTEGFCVEIARGGEDGIAKAREVCPDVIITDVIMRDTSGCEVCDRLQQTPKTRQIPVIAYTGMTDADVLADLFRRGVRVFAIRPCVRAVLAREVRVLLDSGPKEGVRVVTGYGEILNDSRREIEARVLRMTT